MYWKKIYHVAKNVDSDQWITLFASFAYWATLLVEVWDDDPEENGDDLIDQFPIKLLDKYQLWMSLSQWSLKENKILEN